MKKNFISYMRIVATLGVVFLHTNNTLTANMESFNLDSREFTFFSLMTTLMMWAVPFFLMITGELMLEPTRQITFSMAIKKYSRRIVLALFLFGVPFSLLESVATEKTFSIKMIPEAFINVINGNSWSHLWYLYVLIGIYLILPLIKNALGAMSEKDILFLICILFLFNCVFPFINFTANMQIAFVLPISGYALMYLLVGHYISRYKSEYRMIYILVAALISFLGMISLCLLFKQEYLEVVGYNSPFVAIFSTSLYCVMRYLLISRKYIEKKPDRIWAIDRLCFGVYLVHPFFINLTYKVFGVTPKSFPLSFLGSVALWSIFVMLSFASSYILRKIPFFREYIL